MWQDLRYGVRMMRRSPGFTAVAVLSLALGIAANTAIFSLVNMLMLRTLPVREPRQLVQLLSRYPGEPRTGGSPWAVYEYFRDQNHVYSDLIAVSPVAFRVSAGGEDPATLDGQYVTGNFFPTLGLDAAAGRLIAAQDDKPGSSDAAVAVVSWSCWRNRFGGDPAIVGKRILVNGVPAAVVGVAPRGFFGIQVGAETDIWVPIGMEPLVQHPSGRMSGRMGVGMIGRLKPGVSIRQAEAEMAVLNRWRTEQIANASRDPLWRQATMEVEPAGSGAATLRDFVGRPLLVLMAIAGLVLLLACTNIAGMLLARAAGREREMAVRVSLGAGRFRLVRQVLTESLLLSAAGSAIGIVLAALGLRAFARTIASGRQIIGFTKPIVIRTDVDWQVLLFTAVIAVLTAMIFGTLPAWRAFSSAPVMALRESGAAGETRSRRLFGKSLVVAQVALSLGVLTVAALLVQHLVDLRTRDLGFHRDSVLLVRLDPQASGLDRRQLSVLYKDLLGRLEAIPGVGSATLSAVTPIEGAGAARFARVEGRTERPEDRRYLNLNWVAPKYFETMGTRLVAGRDFTFDDERGARVAIVNQAMARRYFDRGDAIGKHLTFDGQDRPYEIVGIVGDAKYLNLYNPAPPTVYMNAFQEGEIFSQFALRTHGRPMAVAADVQRVVRATASTIRVAKIRTLADQMDASIVPERLMAGLSGLFASLSALLAAMGLYGLMAFMVTRRLTEIAVRMALGATGADVMRAELGTAVRLVFGGLALGVPIALWATRLAMSVMPELHAAAAWPMVVAAVLMTAIAAIAAAVPARRAARTDPSRVLRAS